MSAGIIGFIFGIVIGACFGVVITAALSASKNFDHYKNEEDKK